MVSLTRLALAKMAHKQCLLFDTLDYLFGNVISEFAVDDVLKDLMPLLLSINVSGQGAKGLLSNGPIGVSDSVNIAIHRAHLHHHWSRNSRPYRHLFICTGSP